MQKIKKDIHNLQEEIQSFIFDDYAGVQDTLEILSGIAYILRDIANKLDDTDENTVNVYDVQGKERTISLCDKKRINNNKYEGITW